MVPVADLRRCQGEQGRQHRAGSSVCVSVSRDLGRFMNVSLAFGEAEGPIISEGFKCVSDSLSIFWGYL